MGIEEVIRKLEEMAEDREDILPGCLGWDEAEQLCEAVALLKTHPEAQPNEPMTLEDTLKMHGEPAYLCWPDGGEWVLIRVASMEKVELVHRNGILVPIRFVFEGGGKLYRRPPKEERR